jgi:peptidoglycan/LPS O-acetylase OafA/YrhL
MVGRRRMNSANCSKRDLLIGLELTRGLSAIWVLLFHYKEVTREQVINYGYFDSFISQGGKGVELFFVLSGFIMFYKYRTKFNSRLRLFEFVEYVVHRLARILPLHLTTCLLMTIGAISISFMTNSSLSDTRFNLVNIAGSAMLLSFYSELILDINMPSWTLSAEMFAYILLPLMMFMCDRRMGLLTFFCFSLVCLLCFSDFELSPSYRLLAGYSFGIMSYYLLGRLKCWWQLFLLPLSFFVYFNWDSYLVLMTFYMLLIVSVAESNRFFTCSWLIDMSMWLGKISFPLYIVHWPVRTYIRQLYEMSGLNIDSWLLVLCYTVASFLIAIVGLHYIEEPGRKRVIAGYRKCVEILKVKNDIGKGIS